MLTRKARWFARYAYTQAASALLADAHRLGHSPFWCSQWSERIPRVYERYTCRRCGAMAVMDCGHVHGPLAEVRCSKQERASE